jgi:predicted NBD/HSP70 family sugar kinase
MTEQPLGGSAGQAPATPRDPGRPGIGPAARPASQLGMRRQNLALVLGIVAAHGMVSRGEIADSTGLSRAAVGSLAAQLTSAGLLAAQGPAPSGRVGRPGGLLSVSDSGPAGLGLEAGVGHLAACLVDLRGATRAQLRLESANRGRAPREVLAELADVARQVIAQGETQGLRPAGVVVAVPGLVGEPGIVEHAPNLGWRRAPAAALLRARLPEKVRSLPLSVENEANLGALAELWQGTRATNFVHVSAEAGIGAALILDGRLLRGALGFAGELGHVPVHPDGPLCACGAHGCLEQYAGEEAVLRAAGLLDGFPEPTDKPDAAALMPAPEAASRLASNRSVAAANLALAADPVGLLARRAEAGDPRVLDALERSGQALGTALAGAVNLLDPAALVLGGAYADLGLWLLPEMRRELAARVTVRPWNPDALTLSRLGRHGPVLGAALSTVRWIIQDPWAYAQLVI